MLNNTSKRRQGRPNIIISMEGFRGEGSTTIALLVAQFLGKIDCLDVSYAGHTDVQTEVSLLDLKSAGDNFKDRVSVKKKILILDQ